ncbi:hypothetical protein RT761_01835 [Atribacter laminatus]|uniref:DUF4145 domain-containing protein n=1 Tax=Atribacter laminatus TaxID=2847778 RepID=A0A7T1AMF7_ATRLM|nr:hypothetical protein RT761_01835 [Atribacter laminatus]
MSSLKVIEKRVFEDLFGMVSGYVLDFSNNTFAEFFRETTNINIYSQKYAFNGDSKAKRLRAFWETESDTMVGKVLSELLELWRYNTSRNDSADYSKQYEQALEIVSRLTGKQPDIKVTEYEFLLRRYENFSVRDLPIAPNLIPVLESRLAEVEYCLESAPLATIFLCGSILEGILLGVALERPRDFNQANNSPKDRNNKVKSFQEWTLAQFIDVAHGLGILELDVKKFSHELRYFRNHIHPYEQIASKFTPNKHTAEICFQVLKAAIADLSGR